MIDRKLESWEDVMRAIRADGHSHWVYDMRLIGRGWAVMNLPNTDQYELIEDHEALIHYDNLPTKQSAITIAADLAECDERCVHVINSV